MFLYPLISELYEKLAKLMAGEVNGDIRFYYICKTCSGKLAILGCKSEDGINANEDLIII